MIFTKFKRFIAILLCVVVLGSFSLSAFASVNTREYENVNSVMDSFISSFLSYCGVEVEFFNWDNDYEGSQFTNAAWFNLVRNFTQYIENNDAKLSTKISEYASSSGVTSSINSSSYVWTGNFKDCRSIVNFLVSHLYNFLDTYWVKKDFGNGIEYGSWGDIPLNLYIVDDYYSGGFYTRVTFSNAYALTDWYSSVGLEIQDLCEGSHVADDFAGCVFSYRWDYNYLPIVTMYPGENTLSRVFYLDYLNRYISNYEDSPGGGSGDSSGDSSDTPDTPSEEIDPDLSAFIDSYYKPFFLGLIHNFGFGVMLNKDMYYPSDSVELKSSMLDLVDHLYDCIMSEDSYYIKSYYPDMKNDFITVCSNERSSFINTSAYVFNIFANDESRRFTLGFFELFYYEFLNTSHFSGNVIVDTSDYYNVLTFNGNKLRFVFESDSINDLPNQTYFNWKREYKSLFTNFLLSNQSSVPCNVVVFKDIDLNFTSGFFRAINIIDFYEEETGLVFLPDYDLIIDLDYNIDLIIDYKAFLDSSDFFGLNKYFYSLVLSVVPIGSFLSSVFLLLPSFIYDSFVALFVIFIIFSVIKFLLG